MKKEKLFFVHIIFTCLPIIIHTMEPNQTYTRRDQRALTLTEFAKTPSVSLFLKRKTTSPAAIPTNPQGNSALPRSPKAAKPIETEKELDDKKSRIQKIDQELEALGYPAFIFEEDELKVHQLEQEREEITKQILSTQARKPELFAQPTPNISFTSATASRPNTNSLDYDTIFERRCSPLFELE